MQKNDCYGNIHTLPVYEEIQLKDKAVEVTGVRVKPTEKILSSNEDNRYHSTSIKESNLKANCCLSFVFFLLAIAVVAAIGLSAYTLVSSNQGMDNLMKENQKLKLQLNKTKEASETDNAKLIKYLNFTLSQIVTDGLMLQNSNMAQLNRLRFALNVTDNVFMTAFNTLQSSVSSLNITNGATMTQLNSLQSSVSSLNTANGATMTQLNSLQSSVSSLNTANGATMTQLNSLQSSVSSLNTATMAQLNSLQSSVSSLNTANGATTTRLNSLQSSVSSLNTTNEATMTQLNSLHSSVSSLNTANGATMTQLNSLQSSVSSLTTRVNSPVNLYQNCIQETESCTIGPRTTDTYWTECYTAYGPISKAVSLVWGSMYTEKKDVLI